MLLLDSADGTWDVQYNSCPGTGEREQKVTPDRIQRWPDLSGARVTVSGQAGATLLWDNQNGTWEFERADKANRKSRVRATVPAAHIRYKPPDVAQRCKVIGFPLDDSLSGGTVTAARGPPRLAAASSDRKLPAKFRRTLE